MGQIADDMLNGFQCSWCGVCFEEEHGYPVACSSCWNEALNDIRSGRITDVERNKESKVTMINGVQKHIYKEI